MGRECSPALSSRLTEAAAQLSVLSSVICGEEPTSVRGELLRCESEECLMRNSGNVSPVVRQSPQVEDMGCQVGGGVGGGEDQAEEEEQMLGSQLAELQQKLDRMEAEMTIVSEESRELADTLEEREVELLLKLRRLEELRVSNVMEWRDRSPLTRTQVDEDLSPPHQFRVTRRVGSDGLLVAWSPPGQDEVTGYQIFCGSHLLQRVRSASRTKALLHGLPLQEATTLAIHSAAGERLSPPVQVTYSPGMTLPKEKRKSSKGGE